MITMIQAMTIKELVEWYNYTLPIVSACSGFASSEGYMLWEPDGSLTIMSHDRSWLYITLGLRPGNVCMTAKIRDFASARKCPETLIEKTKFLGDNLTYLELINYKKKYFPYIMGQITPLYENDMMNIDGFESSIAKRASESIDKIKFADPYGIHRLMSSKMITPINKGDTAKLYIYPDIEFGNEISVFREVVHKKKYNVDINILSRQMRVINAIG